MAATWYYGRFATVFPCKMHRPTSPISSIARAVQPLGREADAPCMAAGSWRCHVLGYSGVAGFATSLGLDMVVVVTFGAVADRTVIHRRISSTRGL